MLKNLIIFIFSFFLYFNSAMSNDLKIVYVDIDKIINQSNAGKQVTKQLEILNNNNIKKFKQKEKGLADEEKKIIKQQNILSKEELEKKVLILQKKVKNFKSEINTSRKALEKKRLMATSEILKALNKIFTEYSSKNSIALIIQKKNIVIGKSELDITDLILTLVNEKIKNVKLK